MKSKSIFAKVLCSLFILATFPIYAAELVGLSTPEGLKRFESSRDKLMFFQLANQYEPQTNAMFCGPTTAAIVLNTLRYEKLRSGEIKLKPDESLLTAQDKKVVKDPDKILFNRYTPNNVFDLSYCEPKCKAEVKSRAVVMGKIPKGAKENDVGFQLDQFAELLQAHGLKTEVTHVDSSKVPVTKVRADLRSALKSANHIAVVNYARSAVGQTGGGHISPVGDYDPRSDSFLVLDVNPNRADWVWIKTKDLYDAMNTKDTGLNRGYVILSEG